MTTLPKFLYHGTSARHHENILAQGLLPRGRKHANDRVFSSSPRAVYLTEAFAIKFAADALRRDDKRLAIYEVSTEGMWPHQLTVDDDLLVHQFRRDEGLDLKAATRKAQRDLQRYASPHNAALSLDATGSCAHLGRIDRKHITRVCFVDYEAQKWFVIGASDVGTGPLYRFTKDQRLSQHNWLWTGEIAPKPDSWPDGFKYPFFHIPDTREGIEICDLSVNAELTGALRAS